MIERISPSIRQVLVKMNRVLLLGLAVAVATFPVLMLNQTATAAQITTRSVLISNPHVSATANYTFTFTTTTNSLIQSMKFQACTTALGTCSNPTGTPTGINLSGGVISKSGFTDAASFGSPDTTSAGCTTTDVLCITRTSSTPEVPGVHTITDTGVINQNGANCSGAANCTFFIRITTFSDNAYTTKVDYGTVAASTTQRFTVNAAIQEALTFCVGATTIDDMNTSIPPPCSSISGTSLNLGVLNSSNVSVSPVDTATDLGDTNNGIAELSTNAFNGTNVTYSSVQDTDGGTTQHGTLKVPGATCNVALVNTDQCINAIGTTHAFIVPGAEHFGMTIAAVNCKSSTAYTCDFAFGQNNLIPTTQYNGAGTDTYPNGAGTNTYVADTNQVAGTTVGKYAWDDTGTYNSIATASTVVDKEALILKFAATPNAITPTGSYQTSADFVATPVY